MEDEFESKMPSPLVRAIVFVIAGTFGLFLFNLLWVIPVVTLINYFKDGFMNVILWFILLLDYLLITISVRKSIKK
jgi:hypothetical protein